MRAFQAVHDNDRESLLPVRLPVTEAKNFRFGGHFHQALLGNGQGEATPQKEGGDGLTVPSAKAAAGLEDWSMRLRTPHPLILNGGNRPWPVGVILADL